MRARSTRRDTYLRLVASSRGLQRFVRNPFARHPRRARAFVYLLLTIIVVAVTAQRGNPLHYHPTFPIFRASFRHLLNDENLYAGYGLGDRFKYSPTAALLFAPFAIPPFALGLLLWNLVNVGALVYALDQLLPRRLATFALLLLLPEIHGAMQRSQSNSLVAALVVLAFVALERGQQVRGYLAIALGTAIKLFPVAALAFALFHPRRFRAALIFLACACGVVLLPLLVTSPAALIAQYGWWRAIESTDALARGASVMGLLHRGLGVDWPNWPVQIVGVAMLVTPLARVQQWQFPRFRREFLASLLVFIVLFNHQAERPSFVIAEVGVVIWFVSSPRELWRLALVLISLTGLESLGFLPVWAVMQHALWTMDGRAGSCAESHPPARAGSDTRVSAGRREIAATAGTT
ncbi:MAG: glycosyltransferase family 87 protein [Gemmatimonadota bacterium]